MRGHLACHEDRRGAVCSSYYADGGRFLHVEAQEERTKQRNEDAYLRSRPQQEQLRVGEQCAEIGHCADAKEDQGREQAAGYSEVEHLEDRLLTAKLIQVADWYQLWVVRHVTGDDPEADGKEEEGFVVLLHRQVDHHRAQDYHHDVAEFHLSESRVCKIAGYVDVAGVQGFSGGGQGREES